MQTLTVSKPLPLTGARNVRDLGGYPFGGGVTAKGVFLRADGLHSLTEKDLRTLVAYGVRRVVDLRRTAEVERQPDPFRGHSVIQYFHVPMLDQMNSSGFQGPLPQSMYEIYRSLIDECASDLGQVMSLLARQREGASLFHCSAGKDRTGVVAMLLLELAGVPDEEIVADYCISEIYMKELFALQKQQAAAAGIQIPDYMLESKPEQMQRTLDHLHQMYGGAEAFLTGPAGCSEADVTFLRDRLKGKTV